MSVRAQIVGPLDSLGASHKGTTGLYVWASNGKAVVLPSATALAAYKAQAGNATMKMQKATAALLVSLANALGADQLDTTKVTLTFDAATGNVTAFEVG